MKQYVVERAALTHNIQTVLKKAGSARVWGVVKGDGYGLGLVPMAQALREAGIDHFAVTEPSDVRTLRETANGREETILMLRATTDRQELEQLLELDAMLTVGSYEDAVAINGIAGERETVAPVHLKFDTGMGRYGFLPSEMDKVFDIYSYMKHIAVCGIYTHFHSAFCSAKATQAQFSLFQQMVGRVLDAGYETGELHCCNSEALFRFDNMVMDGVRVGSAFLGRLNGSFGLQRVGYAEATIEEIRWLPKGHTCGYGAGWKAKSPTKIAVISVGNFHGFCVDKGNDLCRRRDSLRGILANLKTFLVPRPKTVMIAGQRCRTLGHIGMLHTVADITDCNCQLGDPVTLEINPLSVKGLPVVWR